MTSDTTYNGWKNYETWAVSLYLDGNYDGEGTYLEVLDLVRDTAENAPEMIQPFTEFGRRNAVADALKEWFEENLPDLGASIAMHLLHAAAGEVDWDRLAEHKLREISETVS